MEPKKLKKSLRKKLKWYVILFSTLATIIGAFTGHVALLMVTSLTFWIYVVLDKYNPLVKSNDLSKVMHKTKKKKVLKENSDDVGVKIYDDSHESGY